MSEFYTEILVKRNPGAKERFIKILLILLVILSLPTIIMYRFGLMIAIAAVAFTVFMFIRLDVEYEYLYFNGDLDIDIIYRRTKRKNAFSMNVNEMEFLAPIDAIEVKHYEKLKTYDFSSGKKNGNQYVMIVSKHGQKGRIIFEPNEKIVEDLFYRAPRKVVRR